MKKLLFPILISFIFFSCKKDNENLKSIVKTTSIKFEDGRLKINSLQSFNSLIKDAYNHKTDKNYLQNKFSKDFSNRFISFQMKKEIQNNAILLKLNSDDNVQPEPLIDKLVPDPIFASVLNENGELQVDSTIYKVTKYGTFMIPANKLIKLNSIISLWNSKTIISQNKTSRTQGNNSTLSVFSPYEDLNLTQIEQGFYSIESDIYLYDSYGYTNGNEPNFYDNDESESSTNSENLLANFTSDPVNYTSVWSNTNQSNGGYNGVTNTLLSNEDYIYNNLETYSFGAKTWAGKFFESIRGRDEIHTVNFNNDNRIRVNFYDASYIIYSALGVSVKLQKKNWIGWSKTNADELRIGWDVIQYDASWGLDFNPPQLGYTNPYQATSHYNVEIPGTSHKFELFDLTVGGIRIQPIINYNTNKLNQQAIKYLYDLAINQLPFFERQNLATQPFAYLTYDQVFNDKKILTIGRDEERSTNNDKMDKTFDWRTGTIKLSFNASGTLSPSGEIAKSFELSSASVYGIAKYANVWKGVRIVK